MPRVGGAVIDPSTHLSADTAAGVQDVSSTQMRRVASAPAFKHPTCFQEVSPTAAVAAAAIAAAQPAAATSSRSKGKAQQQAPKHCSRCTGGSCNCLEVYVVSRSFSEFAGPVMKRLHPEARDHLVDIGICHYMTVFKTPDGQLVQFDFGPLGGDVQKAHGPLATFLRRARAAAQKQQLQESVIAAAAAATSSDSSSMRQAAAASSSSSSGGKGLVHSPSVPSLPMASLDLAAYGGGDAAVLHMQDASSSDRPKRGVAGEIREKQLQQLPPACMYMGRTSLTLNDIRQYNAAQGRQAYTLHENDCRHYVNSLVQYTTGVERSTQHLKRHYFHARHADKWLWYGWCVSAAQLVTDVGNWSHIQAGAAVTLLAVTGRSTLASLKTLATPMLPALKGLPALLPAAGLTAAAATGTGAAAPGAAVTAAAAAGPGSTVVAGITTALKLPAALLLKRPLAAGAAAGGAGAAAAVMRDSSDTTTAASSGGSSSSGGKAPNRIWSAAGRPLRAAGEGVAHGVKSAVLGLRRLALSNTNAAQQLRTQPLVVLEGAAGAAVAPSRGSFWGPRSSSSSSAAAGDQPGRRWFSFSGRADSSRALAAAPGSMLAAAGVAAHGQQQQQGQEPAGRRWPFAEFGQHVGRHVLWLGAAAARASGQLALLAFGGSRVAQYAAPPPAPVTTLAAAGALHHSSSSSSSSMDRSFSSHQLQQQHADLGLGADRHGLSLPSLLFEGTEAAPGTPLQGASGPVVFSVSSSNGRDGSNGGSDATPPLGSSNLTFMWDSGSSSSSGGFGGKSSGVGRQVLNLPAPRISWAKRASQAMVVRQ